MDTTSTRCEATKESQTSLGQDLLHLLRYWLRDRRVLIAIAAVAVAGGAFLNWGWLVAIGIAPVILALAPCAAMCALGLCAMNMGKKGAGASCGGENAAAGDKSENSKQLSRSQPPVPESRSDSE